MNRNWEEEIDVPVGPDNGFNVGGADQGQPTHFLPRRNRFVFRVRVPNGFTEKDELVWTLTTHGKTEKAYATLRPDYIVDDVVKASETGALGAGTSSPEVRSNKPPSVRIEEVKARTVKVGEWVTLVAEVKDDGIPKPRGAGFAGAAAETARLDATAASPTQLGRASLRPNRGDVTAVPGHGRQEPRPARLVVRLPRARGRSLSTRGRSRRGRTRATGANSPWAPLWVGAGDAGGRQGARCRCPSEPGTYVLRCVADDGALMSGEDELTIVVVR